MKKSWVGFGYVLWEANFMMKACERHSLQSNNSHDLDGRLACQFSVMWSQFLPLLTGKATTFYFLTYTVVLGVRNSCVEFGMPTCTLELRWHPKNWMLSPKWWLRYWKWFSLSLISNTKLVCLHVLISHFIRETRHVCVSVHVDAMKATCRVDNPKIVKVWPYLQFQKQKLKWHVHKMCVN